MSEVKADPHAPPHHAATASVAKAPPDHPLQAEAGRLKEELVRLAEKHREEVAKLREKVTELFAKVDGENLSKHHEATLGAARTEVETALNRVDPDCLFAS